ncbi:hypothetical protein [Planctomicrobium sp. SH527]|uniref:pyroglutamyl-peptidase I family protein n=1 Tax=Planctomicrobium sp. SH527 TaxID=3448123 RepID=UPI003F5C0016
MRVLVTGFPPFPGRPVNPSELLVRSIASRSLELPGIELHTELLPVEYAGVEQAFTQLMSTVRPQLWLAFGVGAQQSPLRLEQRAANCDNSTRCDNSGELRSNCLIEENGPEFRDLPARIPELQMHLQRAGYTCDLSNDAGTYVCNHLMYTAANSANVRSRECEFVFTHLAPLEFGMPTENLVVALQIMVNWFQNSPDRIPV